MATVDTITNFTTGIKFTGAKRSEIATIIGV